MVSHSYDTYINWSIGFPLAIVSLMGFANIFFILLIFCLRNSATSFLYIYSKIVFRDALKREKKEQGYLFSLHGYKIRSKWQIAQFSSISTMTLSCVFLSFWVTFLIDETAVCDPSVDCFLNYGSTPSPIEDCDDVERNATVQCFEFVFAVSEGFASAIGFLAVVVAYVFILGYLLIWLIETVFDSGWDTCAGKCAVVGWIGLLLFQSFLVIVINIVSLSVPLFRDVIFQTVPNRVKFHAYMFCFAYVGSFTLHSISFVVVKSYRSTIKLAEHV